MKLRKFGALVLLPAGILVFHPLGCAGFYSCEDDATCVEEIPPGWSAYHWIRVVDDSKDTAELCDDGTTPTPYYVGPPKGTHECPSCEAKFVDNVPKCKLPTLDCWVGATCGVGKKLATTISSGGECTVSDNTNKDVRHCSVNAKPTPPKCKVLEGAPIQQPMGPRLDTCRVPSTIDADCLSDEACAGSDSGVTDERKCIFADGLKSSCPSGWDTMLHAYTDYNDLRTCTPCECSATCDWKGFVISDAGNCNDYDGDDSDTITIIDDIDNVCTTLPIGVNNDNKYGVKTKVAPIPRVSSVRGKASGNFDTEGPVTFCCKPTGSQ